MTTQKDKSLSLLPEHPRKGIFVDQRARQYASRVGYDLRDKQRVRSFQYLGKDADEATLQHIQLEREWETTKANWWLKAEHLLAGMMHTRRFRRSSLYSRSHLPAPPTLHVAVSPARASRFTSFSPSAMNTHASGSAATNSGRR